jgi:hypothetical protein
MQVSNMLPRLFHELHDSPILRGAQEKCWKRHKEASKGFLSWFKLDMPPAYLPALSVLL